MLETQQNVEFGYILFKIGDIGPEQIYYENIPTELGKDFKKTSIDLGLYLSLVISQGKGMDTEGLFGPLPWYQLRGYELLMFSFLVKDEKTKDERKKENTLCFLVVTLPRKEDSLMLARYEIEKSLSDYFIKQKSERLVLNEKTILTIIKNSKKVFLEALNSGKKISQEKALDEIITFESMELFAIYSLKGKKLKTCLIGETGPLFPDQIVTNQQIDGYQISVREEKDGTSSLILEFKELDTLIYVQLNHALKSHKLINLLANIDTSLEILSSYI